MLPFPYLSPVPTPSPIQHSGNPDFRLHSAGTGLTSCPRPLLGWRFDPLTVPSQGLAHSGCSANGTGQPGCYDRCSLESTVRGGKKSTGPSSQLLPAVAGRTPGRQSGKTTGERARPGFKATGCRLPPSNHGQTTLPPLPSVSLLVGYQPHRMAVR